MRGYWMKLVFAVLLSLLMASSAWAEKVNGSSAYPQKLNGTDWYFTSFVAGGTQPLSLYDGVLKANGTTNTTGYLNGTLNGCTTDADYNGTWSLGTTGPGSSPATFYSWKNTQVTTGADFNFLPNTGNSLFVGSSRTGYTGAARNTMAVMTDASAADAASVSDLADTVWYYFTLETSGISYGRVSIDASGTAATVDSVSGGTLTEDMTAVVTISGGQIAVDGVFSAGRFDAANKLILDNDCTTGAFTVAVLGYEDEKVDFSTVLDNSDYSTYMVATGTRDSSFAEMVGASSGTLYASTRTSYASQPITSVTMADATDTNPAAINLTQVVVNGATNVFGTPSADGGLFVGYVDGTTPQLAIMLPQNPYRPYVNEEDRIDEIAAAFGDVTVNLTDKNAALYKVYTKYGLLTDALGIGGSAVSKSGATGTLDSASSRSAQSGATTYGMFIVPIDGSELTKNYKNVKVTSSTGGKFVAPGDPATDDLSGGDYAWFIDGETGAVAKSLTAGKDYLLFLYVTDNSDYDTARDSGTVATDYTYSAGGGDDDGDDGGCVLNPAAGFSLEFLLLLLVPGLAIIRRRFQK